MRSLRLLLTFLLFESSIALAPIETRRQVFGDYAALASAIGITTTPRPAFAAEEDVTNFSQTENTIKRSFAGALANKQLLQRVTLRLARYDFDPENTLVASSLCSDEVNRPLEDVFLQYYGNHFAMGGLAGFPFSGVTGFGAMASHIPDAGHCLLVYGPHVGVNVNGDVGTVNRRGVAKTSTCCGSAVAASRYLKAVVSGEADIMPPPVSALDAQQAFVSNMLLPYGSEIVTASEPMVALPYAAYRSIDTMMNQILAKAASKVKGEGKIAMLGGLQINTPVGFTDYFLPLRFDVRNNRNDVLDNLLETVRY